MKRIVAAFIDGILGLAAILVPFFAPLMSVFVKGKGNTDPAALLTDLGYVAFAIGILTVFIWIVQIFLLTKNGQTVGKKLLRIRIVRIDTNDNGGFVTNVLKRLILHFVLMSLPVIGQIYTFLDILFFLRRADRRALHDVVAGTNVVEA
jgi:uncharacterized RDD family membrane protein YckC